MSQKNIWIKLILPVYKLFHAYKPTPISKAEDDYLIYMIKKDKEKK